MIFLENVSKYYKVNGQRRFILRQQSAAFETGYSYAILGVNGAGKSTTMRLLAGAELPNSGKVRRTKRISWPLGFANGFNPQLSGKENLKFVARAYGEDPLRVLRSVCEFAEIGDYVNEPIRTYSSGMMARFAFGVSMAIEFECYLIDEITAVGDARFQKKCSDILTHRRQNADVIMISHDMGTIQKYCDRGFVLVDGTLIPFYDINAAIAAYVRMNR